MTNCSTSCATQDHETFGACMRAKNLRLAPNLSDTGVNKKHDAELQRYRDARAQGIRPDGTSSKKIQQAEELSQQMGQAYDVNRSMFDVTVG